MMSLERTFSPPQAAEEAIPMSETKFRPFHETIVDAVMDLEINRASDLEPLDVLAKLTAVTSIPTTAHIQVAGAFAQKIRVLRQGPPFRRAEDVVASCEMVIQSLLAQEATG